LVSELERYQHLAQHNWRLAQLEHRIVTFWGKNMALWRFLCLERGVQQLADVKRSLILDYIDQRLAAGRAVSGVNAELRTLHSFLLFLQDEGYAVPQSLLRIPSLKQPDRLPKYLTDQQIRLLRAEIERRVRESSLASHKRLALLTRAAFYLLWQCGLRLGELEELRLEDLDFGTNLSRHDLGRGKLTVRNGKGQKDRAVYLTDTTILALKDYLAVRGAGTSDHVFLYRNVLVKKDLIRAQLGCAGERVGVHVYPHRLRHTCGRSLGRLVNASLDAIC
jgi:integrase